MLERGGKVDLNPVHRVPVGEIVPIHRSAVLDEIFANPAGRPSAYDIHASRLIPSGK